MKEKDKRKMKLCLAASSGGHFEQLMMLRPLINQYDGFIITEYSGYSTFTKGEKNYYLKQVNRREFFCFFYMLLNCIKSIHIFFREKPDIIICTGALSMIPICVLGKVFKRKLIYIESFAKTTSPTLTGKLIYKFADLFYVQWESMLEVYPKAVYKGTLY